MNENITFDARTDDPDKIAAALVEYGCVLLRHALPRSPILMAGEAVHANAQRLAEMVGREVNDMPLQFSEHGSKDPEAVGFNGQGLATYTDPLTHSGMTRDWFYEGEKNFRRWFWEHGEEFPNLLLGLATKSKIPEVFEAAFKSGMICSYEHCSIRYQRSDIADKSYGFHQDDSYHSRDAADHSGATIWIPLADCGVEAQSPNLQLYPRTLDEVLPAPPGVPLPHLFCDPQIVMQHYGDQLWAPEMRAGDVIIFNHMVVHRSHIVDGMNKERQSADLRFYPKNKVPSFISEERNWVFDLPGRPTIKVETP